MTTKKPITTKRENELSTLTIERLKELSELSIYEALALAQSEMKNPQKTSKGKMPTKNGFYSFDFAGLDVISAIIRPACNKYGIFFAQPISSELDENGRKHEYLHTKVFKGRESCELAKMELPPDYRDVKTRGGDLTYFQRQQAKAVFFLAGDDDVSDQSGDFTPEISKNYMQSDFSEDDKEAEKREQQNILDDKIGELEDRRIVAKGLGLTAEAYKDWVSSNIGKGQGQMSAQEVDRVIMFLNDTIDDLTASKLSEPSNEDVDF